MYGDILNAPQKRVLPPLAQALAEMDLYLAGGTALALQIGHRPSIDFDWFGKRIGDPEILFHRLQSAGLDFTVLSSRYETVYVEVENVQVSFIGYCYPLLASPVSWDEYGGMNLASLDDIACMKLSAVTNRGSRKDFIDLHHLITNFKPLASYLALFQKKFRQQDIGHVVRSLVYFEEAEREPGIPMLHGVDWQGMKKDFATWVRELNL